MGLFSFKKDLRSSGLLKGAVDRHSHILYSLDDGVRGLDGSLSILSFLEDCGLAELWLTPHVMEDCPNGSEGIRKRFAELCKSYGGPIRLHVAAEYMIDSLFLRRLGDGDLLTMENNTVLVENSVWSPSLDWLATLEKARCKGYNLLLAHPERYAFLTESDMQQLQSMGVKLQLNYGSLVGHYGRRVRSRALELLSSGLYACIGSDCHRSSIIQDQYSRKILDKTAIAALRPLFKAQI